MAATFVSVFNPGFIHAPATAVPSTSPPNGAERYATRRPSSRCVTTTAIMQPPSPGGGSDEQWGQKKWDNEAQAYDQASEQTLEFVIKPGGIVEETVTGVKGIACEKVCVHYHMIIFQYFVVTYTIASFPVLHFWSPN